MPEGPSIVILKEQAAAFADKKIVRAVGSADVDKARLAGQRIVALRSWGKHFLIELKGFSVRVHLLMFGTYRINQPKPGSMPKLALLLDGGDELAFYTCAVVYVEGRLEDTYDWRTDIMSDRWDETHVRRLLRAMPDALVCDALLDQSVFTGVGNIIKNEGCSASACTRCRPSVRCQPPSCASWWPRRVSTASSSSGGRRPAC